MADYFEEMGWQPLADGEAPDSLLHFARLLRDFGMFDVLGEDKKLPPPAAKEAVKNLEEKKCSDADEKCTICLKEYTAGEIVKILPCKHDFHPACILPWLEKTNSCPVCRNELPTDDENYEQYRKEKIRAKQREAEIENLHNSMFS